MSDEEMDTTPPPEITKEGDGAATDEPAEAYSAAENDTEEDADDNAEDDSYVEAETSKSSRRGKRRAKSRRVGKKRGGSTRDVLPDPATASIEEICNQLELNDVELEYTEEDFEQITSLKVL